MLNLLTEELLGGMVMKGKGYEIEDGSLVKPPLRVVSEIPLCPSLLIAGPTELPYMPTSRPAASVGTSTVAPQK